MDSNHSQTLFFGYCFSESQISLPQISSKPSLIDPKLNHRHLPSISFTRRLRDFPPSAIPIAFKRCDFSSRSNPCMKRFDGPIRLPKREEKGAHYYQSVDIGMVLLSARLVVEQGKVGERIRSFLAKLAAHPALVSLTLALLIPMLLSLLVERKWSSAFWMIFNSKGNLCSFWAAYFALMTWVAIHKGVSSAHFAFGCWYAFSTLLDDEFGVKWHRGFHAEKGCVHKRALRYSLVILGYKSLLWHFLASRLLSFVLNASWVLRKLFKQVLGKG